MRISDWSSDVCCADLADEEGAEEDPEGERPRDTAQHEQRRYQHRGERTGIFGFARYRARAIRQETDIGGPIAHQGQDGERADKDHRQQQREREAPAPGLRQRGEGRKEQELTTGEAGGQERSEEHMSELESLKGISYAVFCLQE